MSKINIYISDEEMIECSKLGSLQEMCSYLKNVYEKERKVDFEKDEIYIYTHNTVTDIFKKYNQNI